MKNGKKLLQVNAIDLCKSNFFDKFLLNKQFIFSHLQIIFTFYVKKINKLLTYIKIVVYLFINKTVIKYKLKN